MDRVRKALRIAVPAALLAAVLAPAAVASAGTAPAGSSPVKTIKGKFSDGATFKIQVPSPWNGTLFLYSHGYVTPGSTNPATDVGDPVTGGWLLGHGYALAGSSYATTGWAVQQALTDQIHTLNVFDARVGTPKQTIAWGHSLGGMITAGLVQDYPARFSAALPMCGVLSGGVATWNTGLDAAFAFKVLTGAPISVVNITNPVGNYEAAVKALTKLQKTAKGRARIALGAALADTPGWYTPLSREPSATDYAAQEANQYQWDLNPDFGFEFALRAELEARAGGNVSWNTGVNFFRQFAKSADAAEVAVLYQKAGLSLYRDLSRLQAAPRISADPSAVKYLEKYIVYNGHISIPVLTMHTTGDGLVVPENERAYATVVAREGNSSLLRQVFVRRAGHCAFTPAETITAAQALLNRLATGHWNDSALTPGALITSAKALGPSYNIFQNSQGKVVPTAPEFTSYKPPPYLRPFDR